MTDKPKKAAKEERRRHRGAPSPGRLGVSPQRRGRRQPGRHGPRQHRADGRRGVPVGRRHAEGAHVPLHPRGGGRPRRRHRRRHRRARRRQRQERGAQEEGGRREVGQRGAGAGAQEAAEAVQQRQHGREGHSRLDTVDKSGGDGVLSVCGGLRPRCVRLPPPPHPQHSAFALSLSPSTLHSTEG